MRNNTTVKKLMILTTIITLAIGMLALPGYAASYTYDDLGRLTSVSYNDGSKIDYQYDAGGNMLSENSQVSLDLTATSPADGAVDVPVNVTITATFNQAIKAGPNYSGIKMLAGQTNVPINLGISNNILTITPQNKLRNNTLYTIKIVTGAVRDLRDRDLKTERTFSFTTIKAATTGLHVVSSIPENNSTNINLKPSLELVFSSPIKPAENYLKCSLVDDSGKKILLLVPVIKDSTLYIVPLAKLAVNKTYTLTVPAKAVKDKTTGDPLLQDFQLTFSTQPDTVPPNIIYTDPAAGAANIALDTNLKIKFSEEIRMGPDFFKMTIKDQDQHTVFMVDPVYWYVNRDALYIDLLTKLDPATAYTVFIPARAFKDRGGNYLSEDYSFSFTTQSK